MGAPSSSTTYDRVACDIPLVIGQLPRQIETIDMFQVFCRGRFAVFIKFTAGFDGRGFSVVGNCRHQRR